MVSRDEILKKLEKVKEEIKAKYKIKTLGLFGSFVRGEQKEKVLKTPQRANLHHTYTKKLLKKNHF
ncbi:MAG: nucleotidyltransferase family protein [Candidatus Wukongarchaeota archaeon]